MLLWAIVFRRECVVVGSPQSPRWRCRLPLRVTVGTLRWSYRHCTRSILWRTNDLYRLKDILLSQDHLLWRSLSALQAPSTRTISGFSSNCCIPLTIVEKCCRDPVSEENFLLWRTDNMWSSDPEDRAIVYIRELAEDGLSFNQVPSESYIVWMIVKYTG